MLRFWATVLALLSLGFPLPAQSAKRPNILLILSDDHSAAFVGCQGNRDIRTANLDKFAAMGVRFNRAYTSAPQCVPSRASIMTGRSPIGIQMTRFSAPLPMVVRTYPELLRTAGYFTGVAGRTYHLDGSALPPESARVFEKHQLRTFTRRLDFAKTAGGKVAAILEQYREFLNAKPNERPFFLQLCFSDPHRPLDKNAIATPHDPAKLQLLPIFPDTRLVREDLARYYDEVARFDDSVRQVLEELRTRRLLDSTIVIIMGDNGEALLRGKGTLYDLGLHVPLLVNWPGVTKAGTVSEALISGEDIAPTVLEAIGVAVPKEMTGRSFLKVLRGEPFTGREYAFAERGAHGSGLPTGTAPFDLGRTVIGERYKLIYNALWQLPYQPVDFGGEAFWKELQQLHKDGKLGEPFSRLYFAPQRPMFELFDLKSDPYELKNLAGTSELAAVERELKGALQEWMLLERDYVPLPIPPVKAAKKKKG